MEVLFIIPNAEHYRYFFSDTGEHESVFILGKMFSALSRVSKKLFGDCPIPKWFYELTLACIKAKVTLKQNQVLVFTDLVQKKLPKGFVKLLRENHPEYKYVLLLYNKVSTLYGLDGNIDMTELPDQEVMLPFDRIFSYDLDEAERLRFDFAFVLSNVRKYINNSLEDTQHDVFFCGSVGAKWKISRYEEVDKLYRYLTANGVDCDFRLVFGKNIPQAHDCSYASTVRLPYLEMIRKMMQAKVVLDIAANNKIGITPRFYEALTYNKKYLTNNKAILRHPCYDPRYMRVYEDLSEIDTDWLCSKETVDYHYDGRYTPKGFYRILMEKYAD